MGMMTVKVRDGGHLVRQPSPLLLGHQGGRTTVRDLLTMLHAERLVILVLNEIGFDPAWSPTGPTDPVQLHQLAGVDHQLPVCPSVTRPLVAQSPLGFVPVEEVTSGTTLLAT